YSRGGEAVSARGDGPGAVVRSLRTPADGDHYGPRSWCDPAGGGAERTPCRALPCLDGQEADHRTRTGDEGADAVRHAAGAELAAPAGAARRGRRAGDRAVSLLHRPRRAEVAGMTLPWRQVSNLPSAKHPTDYQSVATSKNHDHPHHRQAQPCHGRG